MKFPTTYARAISAILCHVLLATSRSSPWNIDKNRFRKWSRQLNIKKTRNGINDTIKQDVVKGT